MMNFVENINSSLIPKPKKKLKVLDLFAGCGGLSLGFESAGFEVEGIEMEEDYVQTYNYNLKGQCHKHFLTTDFIFPKADVLIGGPPCQPFSVGGKQKGAKDKRDGFPVFIEAIKQLKPMFILVENVRGLLYKNKWYLDKVANEIADLGYIVETRLINAKHYGIPQNRERVIVVAHKGVFTWPTRNTRQITVREALQDIAREELVGFEYLTPQMDKYIAKYELASKCINPRDLYLDRPARTLTCRNLAGATGDMHRIVEPDGKRRRIVPREAARLQSFPDWFKFLGSKNSVFYQIGNAVPPLLAYQLANSVTHYFDNINKYGTNNRKAFISGSQINIFQDS